MVATSKLIILGGKNVKLVLFLSKQCHQAVLASLFLSSIWIPSTNNYMQALHFKYYFLLCASKTRPGYKQTIQSQSQQSNNHKLMNILTCRYCCSRCQSSNICQQIPASTVVLIQIGDLHIWALDCSNRTVQKCWQGNMRPCGFCMKPMKVLSSETARRVN